MPDTTMAKGRRLRFHILHHDPSVTVADVIGDHDTYRVTAVRGVPFVVPGLGVMSGAGVVKHNTYAEA